MVLIKTARIQFLQFFYESVRIPQRLKQLMEFFALESRADHVAPVLDLFQHLADCQGFHGAQRNVNVIVAFFQPVQESAVRKNVQGFLDELDGQMALFGKLSGRLRLFAVDQSSADGTHNVDIDGEPQGQARARRQIPRLVVAVRLDSEGEFRAAKYDRPADLQPGDEQRHGRKCSVDRAVFRHADLESEIEPQDNIENGAGGDSRNDARYEFDFAVRNEKIKEDKAEPNENIRNELYQKMHGRRKA